MAMKIKAALSHSADSAFEIAEVELDEPRRDEVLVAMSAVGVCHSDLTMKAVWPAEISPIVLGHEGAGIVVAVGDEVSAARAGDHVVLSYRSCGSCPECAIGHRPYCRNFRSLNGIGTRVDGSLTMSRNGTAVYGSYFGQSSFASHALAYESNVVVDRRRARSPHRRTARLRCADRRGHRAGRPPAPTRMTSLVVFGAGAVGLSALMAAQRHRRRDGDRGRSRGRPPRARSRAWRQRDDRPGGR